MIYSAHCALNHCLDFSYLLPFLTASFASKWETRENGKWGGKYHKHEPQHKHHLLSVKRHDNDAK